MHFSMCNLPINDTDYRNSIRQSILTSQMNIQIVTWKTVPAETISISNSKHSYSYSESSSVSRSSPLSCNSLIPCDLLKFYSKNFKLNVDQQKWLLPFSWYIQPWLCQILLVFPWLYHNIELSPISSKIKNHRKHRGSTENISVGVWWTS